MAAQILPIAFPILAVPSPIKLSKTKLSFGLREEMAAAMIKTAMMKKKNDRLKAIDDEIASSKTMRIAYCLYRPIENYSVEIAFITRKLRKNLDQLVPIIKAGTEMGWTDKRIYRELIMSLSGSDLEFLGW